jgi:signal transduction histidine kinase/ligand-binding sensor domain-containing protein
LKRLFHIFRICLATILLLGQRAAAESPFVIENWNTADRLPENTVIALTQSRDGWLWAGTANGFARFDGNTFTPFNVNNTPGLPENVVSFLFEDSHTQLWVGTLNGSLSVVASGVWKTVREGGVGKITAAWDDPNGAVWFVTDAQEIFCWRNGGFELTPPVQSGLRDFLVPLAFHVSVPEKTGVAWKLQNGFVQKWRGNVPEQTPIPAPWGTTIITAACEDDAGNLVVGTRGQGVYWFNPDGSWSHITKADGLAQDLVLSLCFDSEKNLWVGVDAGLGGGGLHRVKKKSFSTPSALAIGVAQSVAEDAQGGLWTAYNLRGLAYARTNSVKTFDTPQNAWCVLVDVRSNVWAGTSGQGLFELEGESFQPVPAALLVGQKIFSLANTKDGKLWVGGDAGLGSFDGSQWNFYQDGLPKTSIQALAEEASGSLWIGTKSEGLFQLRDGKISVANAPLKDISTLLVGTDGSLWVGSSGHGLVHRSPAGQWKTFSSTLNGLANDDINSLAEDAAGNLWIGSYEGLVRVEKSSIADVLAGAAKTLSCRTFLARECMAGAQPSALRAADERLWFPTIEGPVAVNPAELKLNTNQPPVIIESVRVDGVELQTNAFASGWRGAVTLTPQDEQLEIRFTALNFSAPKGSRFGAQFKYWLEGRDKTWTDWRNERIVILKGLAPGDYTFHVIACNEDGVWNEDGATFAITVEPPFWKKTSFLVSVALVFFGVLAGIIYLVSTAKLKRQLRAAQQKELIEHERARIARDLHDQLGANLTQVTLLGEMAEMDKDSPGEVEQHAQQICETARETTRSLDEIVWAVNPSNDTLEGLANYACKYAQDYFALANVSYRAELPPNLPPTPILPEVRHNVFLAFKEAVNNVVKHAHATEARVKLQLEPGKFILSITDNGRGLGDLSGKALRNGLKNMRKRLTDVHGEFTIEPGANGGTAVRLTVPITQK